MGFLVRRFSGLGARPRGRPSCLVSAAALTLVAITLLTACGSGTRKAGSTTTSNGTAKTTGTGKQTKASETTSTTTTETVTTLTGEDEGGVEGCTESGGCVLYVYTSPGGQVFVCNELLVVRVRLVVKVPPLLSTSTGSVGTTTVTDTATTEPTTTSEERSVLRAGCASGTVAIPAVGVEIGDLSELQTSEDGESTWTKARVRLFGHVEDGKFIASG